MSTQRNTPALYLVIDQGGHATRALVYDAHGNVRAQGWRTIETRRPAADRVEHDATELLASLRHAVDQACAGLDAPLEAAGLATQRSTVVCWDRHTGEALSPALSWQDTRNAGLLEALADHADRVRAISGLPPSAHYGASKLRWCLDELPAVRGALEEGRLAWGPLASFLLSGCLRERPLVCDPANAARTLLWDLAHRDWSEELLRLFRLPREPLPACVHTRHAFGTLRAGAQTVPVRICTGDQSAVPFAAGPPDPNTVFINVGTGAFLQRCTGAAPGATARLLTGIIFADTQRLDYTVEGTVNGAGAALTTAADQLGLDRQQALSRIDAGLDSVPVFLNGVGGLGSPWWHPEFPSTWIGEGTPQQRFQAVFESVLFLIQSNLDELEKSTGAFRRIVVGGGFAGNPVFLTSLAGLSNRPVSVPADTELTARGVAALLANGELPAPDMTETRPMAAPRLQHRYRRWRTAMRRALD